MKLYDLIYKICQDNNFRDEQHLLDTGTDKDIFDIYHKSIAEYAKIKCKEQRDLCAQYAKGIYKDYPPSCESIINSPEPNFD